MPKPPKSAQPLVDAGLRCPNCRGRLKATTGGIECKCGISRDFETGVLDLSLPRREAQESLAGKAEAIITVLGLSDTRDVRRAVELALGRVPRTGNLFFDAEEEIFLDRFGRENFQPSVVLGPVYPPARVRIGSPFVVALRVKNDGASRSVRRPPRPLLLAIIGWTETAKFGVRGCPIVAPRKTTGRPRSHRLSGHPSLA